MLFAFSLDVMLDEGQRGEDFDVAVLGGDDIAGAGADRDTLERRALGAGLAMLLLDLLVAVNAVKEFLTALGEADVLDAQVETLLHLAVADDLVDLHTDGVLGDVENDTSAAVVVRVRHTLLDGGVADNVDVVATLVLDQVPGQGGHTMAAETLGVLVTRVRAETSGVRHVGKMGSRPRLYFDKNTKPRKNIDVEEMRADEIEIKVRVEDVVVVVIIFDIVPQ